MNINMSEAGNSTLSLVRENIIKVKSKESVNLLNQWYGLAIMDSKAIVKNKYLVIELFMRLL
jgi:hypothetical protein